MQVLHRIFMWIFCVCIFLSVQFAAPEISHLFVFNNYLQKTTWVQPSNCIQRYYLCCRADTHWDKAKAASGAEGRLEFLNNSEFRQNINLDKGKLEGHWELDSVILSLFVWLFSTDVFRLVKILCFSLLPCLWAELMVWESCWSRTGHQEQCWPVSAVWFCDSLLS